MCTPGCLHWGRKGTRGSPHLHGFNMGKSGLSSGPFCLPPGGEVRWSGLGRARLHHHLGKAAYCQWDVAALFKKRSDCEIRPSPNSTLLGRDSTRECCRQRTSFPSSPRETLCRSTLGNGIASSCSHFSRRRLSRGQPSERHTNIGRQPVQQRHWSERLLPRPFSMHFSAWRHTAVCAIDLNLPEFPFDPAPILVAGRALLISEQSPSLPGLNPDNSAAMY